MSHELQEKIKMQQQAMIIENVAKKFLDKAALERYGNLKVAHPEKALQVASLIYRATQAGQMQNELDDDGLKELLRNLQEQREFRFIRK